MARCIISLVTAVAIATTITSAVPAGRLAHVRSKRTSEFMPEDAKVSAPLDLQKRTNQVPEDLQKPANQEDPLENEAEADRLGEVSVEKQPAEHPERTSPDTTAEVEDNVKVTEVKDAAPKTVEEKVIEKIEQQGEKQAEEVQEEVSGMKDTDKVKVAGNEANMDNMNIKEQPEVQEQDDYPNMQSYYRYLAQRVALGRQKRSLAAGKRSTAVRAEDMSKTRSISQQRRKRDLGSNTGEEIKDLLSDNGEPEDGEGDVEYDDDVTEEGGDGERDPLQNVYSREELQDLLDGAYDRIQSEEDMREKERLLQYLYDQNEAERAPAVYENEAEQQPLPHYRIITHEGVPGVFIPIAVKQEYASAPEKRAVMYPMNSLTAGMRKRSYNEEPADYYDDANRIEDDDADYTEGGYQDNSDIYERLLKLAQSLRRESSDAYDADDDYRKK